MAGQYITSNQGRPINGVSQQPDKSRHLGQCSLSENFTPDVVKGLSSRNGTIAISELVGASLDSKAKWFSYRRGSSEEYYVQITPTTGLIKVWSATDGAVQTVDTSTMPDYIKSSDPNEDLDTLTVGDYTFILNKQHATRPDQTAVADLAKPTSIFYVQFADYGQIQGLFVWDAFFDTWLLVAEYTCPDGAVATDKDEIALSYITNALYTAANSGTSTDQVRARTLGYKYEQAGDNTIWVTREQSAGVWVKPQLQFTDDANGLNGVAIMDRTTKTTMLPKYAPEDFVVHISPAGDAKNKSYYLKSKLVNPDDTDSKEVSWQECQKPGSETGIDTETLPYTLIRDSIDGGGVAHFVIEEGAYDNRQVGDQYTNPHPSFISKQDSASAWVDRFIDSIGLFQNRLFFTSGESVIMSRSSDYFNFYRETTQAALSTDPIDIYADVPEVNMLKANVSFDGDLVLFSEQGQFILSGAEAVTPSNATLQQSTNFESELDVKPVASGDSVFFAFNLGEFSGIREFFTDSITDTKRARPITDHVKEYIKGPATLMATSTNLGILAVKGQEENELYLYNWIWQGEEKVQSAWGKMVFDIDDEIRYLKFRAESMYLVIEREGKMYLEQFVQGNPDDFGLTYAVSLDQKQKAFWNREADYTWKTEDPFPTRSTDDVFAVRSTGSYEEDIGTGITFERPDTPDGYLYTSEELNSTGAEVTSIIGTKFDSKYIPTQPVALDEKGQAMNLDRLNVEAFYMNYDSSGDLVANVTDDMGFTRTIKLTPRTFGTPTNIIGFSPVHIGKHRVPIRKLSDKYTIEFVSSSFLPLVIRDFEFSGRLNKRGRRI